MKNKKGLLIGGLIALAGVIGGKILMDKRSEEKVVVDNAENVEDNESNTEE